jgi:hydrogenase expression/formation protein HypE
VRSLLPIRQEEGTVMKNPGLHDGPSCPAPAPIGDGVRLGHGSGGRLSARLFRERFLPAFDNEHLQKAEDGALLQVGGAEVVVSTDSFVVSPLEFPGGNIGDLAVNGTVNDLAMMGATPRFLTAGFILEEGLPFPILDRILAAMSSAAREAGVVVAAGDTKVVEVGKADGLFINTTGVGTVERGVRPSPLRIRPGDAVLLSGPMGCHGIAILAARGELAMEVELESDTAPLHELVDSLLDQLGSAVHALRDPTRGGVASALNEMAVTSRTEIVLRDDALPVPPAVEGACELLGLDPLYVANEGILVAIVSPDRTDDALAVLRRHPLGRGAVQVGMVTGNHPGLVTLRTSLGGHRVVDLLSGDQLPRIC